MAKQPCAVISASLLALALLAGAHAEAAPAAPDARPVPPGATSASDAHATCLARLQAAEPQARVRFVDGALLVGEPAVTTIATRSAPATVTAGDATLAPASVWTQAWSTAPAVAVTSRISVDPRRVVLRAGDAPLLVVDAHGAALAIDPCERSAFVRWAYFPYLLHALVAASRGVAPVPLAAFSASPIPSHAREALGALALLVALALGVVLVGSRLRARQDDEAIVHALDTAAPPGWRRPGFERPLAGLLFYIAALLILLGPYLYLTSVLLPSRVQPFPEVDGALAPIEELLLLGWAIADLGMTSAVVRAVASLRATQPSRLVAHLRLLLRWQLLVATTLGLAGAAIALYVLPSTSYAILSRALLLRSLTAPLVALAVLPAICEALQRYDRQLVLELTDKRLLAVLLPIPIVLWLRAHASSPSDEAQRALIGVALGQGAAALITGLVALKLVRRLGLPLRALLVGPQPDRVERAALYRFGAGIMAGKAVFFLAGAAELALVVARLRGYPTWLGIKQILLGRLLYPLWLLWPFCESAVPCIAEALAAGKRALARGYVVRYLQHGHLFVGTLFALVLGAGAPLLRARLPYDWQVAAELLPLAGLTALLLPLTWIGDAIQRASGRSGLNAGFLLGEQLARLALLAWLLPRLGLAGLFLASFVATVGKTLLVFLHTHRRLLALALPARIVALGPIVGAIAVGLVGRGLVAAALHADQLGLAEIAFALSALLAFPLALFSAGLAGGLEPAALFELEAASAMVPLSRVIGPTTRLLLRAARLGAALGISDQDHEVTVAAATERRALVAASAVGD